MIMVHPAEAVQFINIPEGLSADEGSYLMIVGEEEGVTEEEDAVLSVDQLSLHELHIFLPTFSSVLVGFTCCLFFQ